MYLGVEEICHRTVISHKTTAKKVSIQMEFEGEDGEHMITFGCGDYYSNVHVDG